MGLAEQTMMKQQRQWRAPSVARVSRLSSSSSSSSPPRRFLRFVVQCMLLWGLLCFLSLTTGPVGVMAQDWRLRDQASHDTSGEEDIKRMMNNEDTPQGAPNDAPPTLDDRSDDNSVGDTIGNENGEKVCAFQRQTKVHATNPNKYYYRFYREDKKTGDCGWSQWRAKEFAAKPFPNAVRVRGRWYENPNSNRFYAGYGKWRVRHPWPHPTNPTLKMVAGQWVKKKNPPAGVVLGTNGKWYRNSKSSSFYKDGRWVREKRRNHPTDPTLWWVAGSWQRKPDNRMPGFQKFTKVGNRWFRAPAGDIPRCFQYWKNGHWVFRRFFRQHRNDPRYHYNRATGKFDKKTNVATRKYVKRLNRWYRSYWSPMYYKNLKWVRESPNWRDPRFRKSHGRWITVRRNPNWVQVSSGPKSTLGGALWYRNARRTQYWWYGRWVRRKVGSIEARARANRLALARLRENPGPLDLDDMVDQTTEVYFRRFIKWFLRDYLKATVQKAHTIRTRSGFAKKSWNTFSGDKIQGRPHFSHRMAASIDLSGRPPWLEDHRLSRWERNKELNPAEFAALKGGV